MATRGARLVLPGVWLVGCIAAVIYSHQQHIPPGIALPVALAFLLELSMYLEVRRVALWPPAMLWVSALAPYVICAAPLGALHLRGAMILAVITGIACAWFAVLRYRAAAEILFLAFMAGIYIWNPFREIYPAAESIEDLYALGRIMWIRVGIAAILGHRGEEGIGFGFIPTRREWMLGIRYFVFFLPLGIALVAILQAGTARLPGGWWWKAAGTFLGILWVVAISEEFFFRGLLQPRLVEWWGTGAGIAAASLAFGLVHLGFRHQFPNWKMVVLAGAAGLFFGKAFAEGKAIRASMVTHALVATCMKVFVS